MVFAIMWVQVPKGHVWLQGDNIVNSTDSRHYGPVPYTLLRGRVLLRFWPPQDAGWIRNQMSMQQNTRYDVSR